MEQDKLNEFSSQMSKILRKNFGRGPKSCQSTVNNNYLVTYVQGFISPMEEVLLGQGQQNNVEKARNVIIETVLEELKGYIKGTLDAEVDESYHDWNFPNNSGIVMFILDREIDKHKRKSKIDLTKLEFEVGRISKLVQKVPDKILVHEISQNIVLVHRLGILIPIEKALVDKGFKDELIITKDSLEKSYFHRYGKFDDIFHCGVKDIFIDWNVKEDKSLLAFVLST